MRPVRLGVPYTAGGPADVLPQQLSQKRGQPVIVDDKPGANEIVAAQEAARAPGDGCTFPMATGATFSLDKYLHSNIPYEPTAFVPVTELVNANLMLVAQPDLPAGNLQEFVRYARQNPGKLDHSSVGVGGVNPLRWLGSTAWPGCRCTAFPATDCLRRCRRRAPGASTSASR